MAGKKKTTKKVLVKVSDLSEEELDDSIDSILDALFGPEETPPANKVKKGRVPPPAKKGKPKKARGKSAA